MFRFRYSEINRRLFVCRSGFCSDLFGRCYGVTDVGGNRRFEWIVPYTYTVSMIHATPSTKYCNGMCFGLMKFATRSNHFELFVYFGGISFSFIGEKNGQQPLHFLKRWKQILHNIWWNLNCKLIASYIIARIMNWHQNENVMRLATAENIVHRRCPKMFSMIFNTWRNSSA